MSALRGSGAQQKQYATVYATNHSARTCWLVGYATVGLRSAGAAFGAPATPAGTGEPALALAPRTKAQALLHGPSTCEAGVSDSVRVSAPGQSAFTDVAGVPMRGCALTIDAFTLAAA